LTSLRFFAAFYVLVFHSGGPALTNSGRLPALLDNLLMNGYLGVTFFFVLSGFILTYVYYGKLTTQEETTRYAAARFARVYPVYLLSLLLMVPFVSSTGFLHTLPQFILLQSWIPLAFADGSWVANWNMQAWTLSTELFFYLMFPWLIRFVDELPTKNIAACAVSICAAMVILRLPGITEDRNLLHDGMRLVPLPLLRAPEFIYGVLLGVLYRRGAVPETRPLLYVAFGMTLAILCSSKSLWIAPVAAVLSGAVIALVPTSLGDGLFARFLNAKVMVLLGAASYALYLLQLPVHSMMRWLLTGDYALAARLLYIPILLIVSVLVFLFYEETMRTHLRGLLGRQARPA
jgi:peptidoglycan/LPS O-acetylase OafA/YrhL